MTQGGGGCFPKCHVTFSSDFWSKIFYFWPLPWPLLIIKSGVKWNKKLFGSRIHTLSQMKLVLAALGFHMELQMIKLQRSKNVTPQGGGGGQPPCHQMSHGGGRGLKWAKKVSRIIWMAPKSLINTHKYFFPYILLSHIISVFLYNMITLILC